MRDQDEQPERVLVVDDDPKVCELLVRILTTRGYRCSSAATVPEARIVLGAAVHELVLCDVRLPGESGLDFLAELESPAVVTLMITGLSNGDIADQALALGAYGYVTKPFRKADVTIAVSNALHRRRLELENQTHLTALEERVEERTRELARSRSETIRRLSRAVEFRDEQTGGHIERMSRYCELLARKVGLDAETILIASPMHDAGKIAVRDAILCKPGALTAGERHEMERHAEIGHALLTGSESDLLELAATIALTHHERFDGTGYPRGLSGEQIPLPGQIAAIADVFDALTSDRAYRPAMTIDAAVETMRRERGGQFNPELLDVFLDSLDQVTRIREAHADRPRDGGAGGEHFDERTRLETRLRREMTLHA
jgi:putative two-component system response regulator